MDQPIKQYLFDVKLFTTLLIPATSEDEARKILNAALNQALINCGALPDGSPLIGEASPDGHHELIEIDGEDPETFVNDDTLAAHVKKEGQKMLSGLLAQMEAQGISPCVSDTDGINILKPVYKRRAGEFLSGERLDISQIPGVVPKSHQQLMRRTVSGVVTSSMDNTAKLTIAAEGDEPGYELLLDSRTTLFVE